MKKLLIILLIIITLLVIFVSCGHYEPRTKATILEPGKRYVIFQGVFWDDGYTIHFAEYRRWDTIETSNIDSVLKIKKAETSKMAEEFERLDD